MTRFYGSNEKYWLEEEKKLIQQTGELPNGGWSEIVAEFRKDDAEKAVELAKKMEEIRLEIIQRMYGNINVINLKLYGGIKCWTVRKK